MFLKDHKRTGSHSLGVGDCTLQCRRDLSCSALIGDAVVKCSGHFALTRWRSRVWFASLFRILEDQSHSLRPVLSTQRRALYQTWIFGLDLCALPVYIVECSHSRVSSSRKVCQLVIFLTETWHHGDQDRSCGDANHTVTHEQCRNSWTMQETQLSGSFMQTRVKDFCQKIERAVRMSGQHVAGNRDHWRREESRTYPCLLTICLDLNKLQ